MDEVVDVRNAENVCRLCLSSEEPRSSVFADRAAGVSLVTKIQAFLSIEILASDKLSTSICASCLTRVNKWHAYKESCIRSQEKQQRCLAERTESIPQFSNIKTEPMDFDEPAGSFETVPLTSDEEWETIIDEGNESTEIEICSRPENSISPKLGLAIKREALEDDETQNTTEIESVCSTELLLNPMAVSPSKEDRLMEADSTQKLFNPKSIQAKKKKVRRGPSTHYRGTRRYKQRCNFCQIYLHSKLTYSKHMERFHSGKKPELKVKSIKKLNNVTSLETNNLHDEIGYETEEMIEDVEDELISLEKDAPLTPVQQNIISQLKTFSCYSCQLTFHDRRSTLNHIRHHMPDLRPYTCIACLTEFADRSIYKLHCGASFQCAMKIALVIPEHGTEKYFTCNMCLRPLSNRKELLSHLSRHSDKQYEQLVAEPFRSPPKLKPMSSPVKKNNPENRIPIPFMNGDPSRNNLCKLCGMIYKRKALLLKHIEICKHLSEENRVCYRCVHCGATFLAFSKFVSHLKIEHKKRDIVCSFCWASFKEHTDYLEHIKQHRSKDFRLPFSLIRSGKSRALNVESRDSKDLASLNRWSCALCPGSTFPTRSQLAVHRRVHVKLKVYTCTVCQITFGRHELNATNIAANTSQPGAKLDGSFDAANASKVSIKSDPGADSGECHACGKVFSSYRNLRRHVRNAHDAPGRYNCLSCSKDFRNEQDWVEHVEREHKESEASICCPHCAETIDNPVDSAVTINTINIDDPLACYICGKKFQNEKSLQIHRGHHSRVNNKLSIGKSPKLEARVEIEDDDDPISILPQPPPLPQLIPVKSPRARKSFPNGRPVRQMQKILQCQVCDDRFNDVANLRKHLWDVHCARNKPEKVFQSVELQCELCTNVLPDEESLRSHMKWHENNPILSNKKPKREASIAECGECGKCYSSVTSLKRHENNHKVRNLAIKMKLKKEPKNGRWGGNGFTCNVCQKLFATNATLNKHREAAHPQKPRDNHVINPVRPQLDFDTLVDRATANFNEQANKPVACSLCRKLLPNKQELYKHRVRVHRIMKTDSELYGIMEKTRVPCTACNKVFNNASNMRQHYTKAHANLAPHHRCGIEGCNLAFKSYAVKKEHEKTHAHVTFNCPLCPKRMLNHAAMMQHINREHKNSYTMDSRKNEKTTNAKKANSNHFAFKGTNGLTCTICMITYPNYKALRVHCLKVHRNLA